jgi:pyruvate dehydrogenase E2 component (dihydrolipoamide acetyltransferase)
MAYGMVTKWFKREGELVKKGEPLFEVEAEKVTTIIESPTDGILSEILVAEGFEANVGEVVAIIETATVPCEEAMALPSKSEKKIPLEVKLSVPAAEIIPLKGIRKLIAERMVQSHSAIPHITLTMEVDMSEANKLRSTLEKASNKRIIYDAIFAKAVGKALCKYPVLNSTLEEQGIRIYKEINIGVAVASPDGLVVPVVHKVNERSLIELSDEVEKLVQKAREGKLSMTEVYGGTFTITNLGMFGIDVFTPIIVPGQAAILGIGRIVEKPYLDGGQLKSRPIVTLSLTCDHRVLDGALAAQFLQEIKRIIESPDLLIRNIPT